MQRRIGGPCKIETSDSRFGAEIPSGSVYNGRWLRLGGYFGLGAGQADHCAR